MDGTTKIIIGSVAGLTAGLIAGYLLAPSSVEQLKERASVLKDDLREIAEKSKASFQEIRDLAESMAREHHAAAHN